jgi:hypothetical protein
MRKRIIMATAAVWLLATLAPAVAAPAAHETASMLTLPGMVEVEGSTVSLVATESKATVTVRTSDLVAAMCTPFGRSRSRPLRTESVPVALTTWRTPMSGSSFNR